MKILIAGGDGYLGWPTAMHLSALGHDTLVVDNFLRRQLCHAEDCPSLFPIVSLHDRVRHWKQKTGITIGTAIGDLTNWGFVEKVFDDFKPDAVIHYAEQPSAPYSMKSREAGHLTLHNNITTTFNLVQAIHLFMPDCHLIKLGTMGEYGTPNIDIEEGWLDITHNGRTGRFLYPRQAGSLYHTTKVMDTDLLWFYVRVWGLRVTDLMQGPVYGIETAENEGCPDLYSAFNYDEIFGTVLNRFMVQAVCGHPLTVYGKGGQTRGYLSIKDTLQCVRLALETPAAPGDMRIFNQFVETFSVNELAEKVAESGRRLGLDVKVQRFPNPRKELEDHYYNPRHSALTDLGLKPHLLTESRMDAMLSLVLQYRHAVHQPCIVRGVAWA